MKQLKFTNIKIVPSQTAKQKIKRFCRAYNLPYQDFAADPHCTIAFSREILVPAVQISAPPFQRILVQNAKLDVFDTRDDGQVLVIRFEAEALSQANAFYRSKYKIPAKYPYLPHITLQKNIRAKPRLKRLPFNFYLDKIVIHNC